MHSIVATFALLAISLQCASAQSLQRIEQAAIAGIMRTERAKGYDITVTANGVRLQAAVIIQLVRDARQRDAEHLPLLLGHEEYFGAFMTVAELSADRAPKFIRVGHEHGEDLIIEYRPQRVIRQVRRGPVPELAMTVCGGWAAATPPRYSYDDTMSSPNVRSIHERVNSYRLLDFGSSVMHDEITGIGGRATSGFLGVVFNLLGDARAVESRMAVAQDGTQLVLATARKGFAVSKAVTVTPDGHTEAGVPGGRPDLVALEKQLAQRVDIDYVPFECRPGEALISYLSQ